jgi:hypothetical protein
MKLIYKDKRSKIFLGDNFKSDLGIIFSKGKLQGKTAILITGIESYQSLYAINGCF